MFEKTFLQQIADNEKVSLQFLQTQLASGRVVILKNNQREFIRPVAVGGGLKIKINTNIGTSTEKIGQDQELEKLDIALTYGTDTVMDLSTGGDIPEMLDSILARSTVAVGTVPIYEAALNGEKKYGSFDEMRPDEIFDCLDRQGSAGVDFFTIHAGIRREFLKFLKEEKRTAGIVSRGGAILARWMDTNGQENPLYESFDTVLDIAKKYNVTISLGDALRPGALADSTDRGQLAELHTLGELVKRCWKKGVQVMVEGPGHIRIDEVALNMQMQKKICFGAPFYVLGPLTTDIACGYDHITSSIGGAIAALSGADFLCVVTPAEHLRHPDCEDIKLGVIASKIAAHSVDLLRFPDEWERDLKISQARSRRDWPEVFRHCLDKEKAQKYRESAKLSQEDICSMCGTFCSLKLIEKCNLVK
ncbi:MAG: phosphomethylpyrimidine synthase ThiC [Candidatus Omnitrophica bacterium]|nr:phosphomethylpyrimidine synthase ThiC [Candidatus Omnitrophota bacterium]